MISLTDGDNTRMIDVHTHEKHPSHPRSALAPYGSWHSPSPTSNILWIFNLPLNWTSSDVQLMTLGCDTISQSHSNAADSPPSIMAIESLVDASKPGDTQRHQIMRVVCKNQQTALALRRELHVPNEGGHLGYAFGPFTVDEENITPKSSALVRITTLSNSVASSSSNSTSPFVANDICDWASSIDRHVSIAASNDKECILRFTSPTYARASRLLLPILLPRAISLNIRATDVLADLGMIHYNCCLQCVRLFGPFGEQATKRTSGVNVKVEVANDVVLTKQQPVQIPTSMTTPIKPAQSTPSWASALKSPAHPPTTANRFPSNSGSTPGLLSTPLASSPSFAHVQHQPSPIAVPPMQHQTSHSSQPSSASRSPFGQSRGLATPPPQSTSPQLPLPLPPTPQPVAPVVPLSATLSAADLMRITAVMKSMPTPPNQLPTPPTPPMHTVRVLPPPPSPQMPQMPPLLHQQQHHHSHSGGGSSSMPPPPSQQHPFDQRGGPSQPHRNDRDSPHQFQNRETPVHDDRRRWMDERRQQDERRAQQDDRPQHQQQQQQHHRPHDSQYGDRPNQQQHHRESDRPPLQTPQRRVTPPPTTDLRSPEPRIRQRSSDDSTSSSQPSHAAAIATPIPIVSPRGTHDHAASGHSEPSSRGRSRSPDRRPPPERDPRDIPSFQQRQQHHRHSPPRDLISPRHHDQRDRYNHAQRRSRSPTQNRHHHQQPHQLHQYHGGGDGGRRSRSRSPHRDMQHQHQRRPRSPRSSNQHGQRDERRLASSEEVDRWKPGH